MTPIESLIHAVDEARSKAPSHVRGLVCTHETWRHLMQLAALAQHERDMADLAAGCEPSNWRPDPNVLNGTALGIPVRVADPPDPEPGEAVLTFRMPIL